MWVNLALVYPGAAGGPVQLEDGLDLRATAHGTVMMWNRATSGEWVAWTKLTIGGGGASA